MNAENLFRKQVFEAREAASSKFGATTATVPPSWTRFILFLSALLFAFILFSFVIDYSRRETAKGFLTYSKGQTRVFAETSGLLNDIYVFEGSRVLPGEPLYSIKNEKFLETGRELGQNSQDAVAQQISSLNSQMGSLRQSKLASEKNLKQRAINLKDMLKSAKLHLNALKADLAVKEKRLLKYQSLFSEGLVTEIELLSIESQVFSAKANYFSVKQDIERNQSELSQIPNLINDNAVSYDAQKSRIVQEITGLESQKDQLSYQTNSKKLSNRDGFVTASRFKKGEVVREGDFILSIVPVESKLVGELYIPSEAIALVNIGQNVRVSLSSLPFQKYGYLEGKITALSTTAFRPEELGVISESDFLYRAELKLKRQNFTINGNAIPFRAGMEFTAEIIIERKKLFNWLLDGIFKGGA